MGDVALLVVSAGDVGEAAWLMAGGRAAGGVGDDGGGCRGRGGLGAGAALSAFFRLPVDRKRIRKISVWPSLLWKIVLIFCNFFCSRNLHAISKTRLKSRLVQPEFIGK